MPASLAAVLLTLFAATLALARFTVPGCWQRNCLVQNDAGTLCLQAAFNGPPKDCGDAVLSSLLDVHIHSKIGLSVAYYDEHGSFLGPTIWPIPNPLPFTVFVCMTGRRSDTSDGHRTARHDDDIHDAAAHIRECAVELPQRFVSDGCYTASPESSAAANSLDRPALVHALFQLCLSSAASSRSQRSWRGSASHSRMAGSTLSMAVILDVFSTTQGARSTSSDPSISANMIGTSGGWDLQFPKTR